MRAAKDAMLIAIVATCTPGHTNKNVNARAVSKVATNRLAVLVFSCELVQRYPSRFIERAVARRGPSYQFVKVNVGLVVGNRRLDPLRVVNVELGR
jgi:hypothetical protein